MFGGASKPGHPVEVLDLRTSIWREFFPKIDLSSSQAVYNDGQTVMQVGGVERQLGKAECCLQFFDTELMQYGGVVECAMLPVALFATTQVDG